MTWLRFILLCGVFVVGLPGMTPTVAAQDPAAFEQAKALFLEGTTAAAAGQWEKAAKLFKQSYDISGRESALLNYAASLKELRRFMEARASLQKLLADHVPTAEQRLHAQALLDEVTAQIAVLDLRGMDRDVTHDIELNGEKVPDEGRRPMRIEEDPGPVDLRVMNPEWESEVFSWQGTAEPGKRVEIDVTLNPPDEPTIFESPWFWVATGAVVLAGAAVGTYFLLDAGADLEPESDLVVNADL